MICITCLDQSQYPMVSHKDVFVSQDRALMPDGKGNSFLSSLAFSRQRSSSVCPISSIMLPETNIRHSQPNLKTGNNVSHPGSLQ